MKKRILSTLCTASLLLLTACGEKSSVIPDDSAMQTSLKDNKYTVTLSNGNDDFNGTLLSAISGSDYLKVYRFSSADECDLMYEAVANSNSNADMTYKYTNDAEFGNLIICGTKNAVKAAGIKIVEVKAE